jgi:transcriptional regulator with XRE-family HTH domain
VPNTAKEPQVALGRAICMRREELEISQQTLGLELGKDQGWISHIENGRSNPGYGAVNQIARLLGLRLSELVALAESIETADRRPLDRPLRPKP